MTKSKAKTINSDNTAKTTKLAVTAMLAALSAVLMFVFAVLSELIVFAFDFVITTTPEKLFRVVGKKKNPATNVTGLRTKIKQTNRLFCRIFSYPDYNRRCLNFTDSAGFHLFVDFNHRWRISLRPEDNC